MTLPPSLPMKTTRIRRNHTVPYARLHVTTKVTADRVLEMFQWSSNDVVRNSPSALVRIVANTNLMTLVRTDENVRADRR